MNTKIFSCLPYGDKKYCYFRFHKDGVHWVGWFPHKFYSALIAYTKPLKHKTVLIKRISTHGKAEYLSIAGSGLALSMIAMVVTKQMHGTIRTPKDENWSRALGLGDHLENKIQHKGAWNVRYPKNRKIGNK